MDPKEFKKQNQLHWKENTPYWVSNSLRQVEDTSLFLEEKLNKLFKSHEQSNPYIIYDFGYGNCWLLELLLKLKINFEYVGFDFNKEFIEIYKKKYSKVKNVSFVFQDLEETIDVKFLNKADFVFTLFTLFEIPRANKVFQNINLCLKEKGHHIMLSIDSFYLMLALSENMEELKGLLKKFDKYKSEGKVPYFFQDIDLGSEISDTLKYASVLYTTSDYMKLARENNLELNEFDELVKTAKFMPKVYQYYDFIKRK